MTLNDKTYDILKWLACVALDAIGQFYYYIAEIWGLPYGDKIWQTLSQLSILIGVLIGISTAQYNKARKNELEALSLANYMSSEDDSTLNLDEAETYFYSEQ